MIVSIFGCPNAGKTTLRKALAERHPEMNSYCIDDFRRKYGDGTTGGEFLAQTKFLETMKEEGFYESSGAGLCARDALEYFVDGHYVIVVDTPEDVCISRIREGKYDGIPFPFDIPDDAFIHQTIDFLKSMEFRRWCVDIPVLSLDGMLPLEEQVIAVEGFVGL
ncbi:MAG: hypothetical protein IJ856_04130 [Candidatus Methanomethylophilaceae archaeon]|nr:hypothetical protein [Candidatus Methanomethylophilaceae archaeon]